MTASDDLVQRLRSIETSPSGWSTLWFAEAADEIVRLQAWKAEATEVLEGWTHAWVVAGRPGALGQSKSYALADEVVRLQQALRDLLDAEDDFHVKAKQTHDSASAHAFLVSSKARDRALAAALAVLSGDQQ